MLMFSLGDCLPSDPRPRYEQMFTVYYTPDPDCLNRDAHIRFLTAMKDRPVHQGDNIVAYDHAIDLYVARLQHYCQQ